MEQVKHIKGFTLIELMISITIAGILLSVAAPNFRSVTEKAQRTSVQMTLLSMHMQQQQYYLQHGKYADASDLQIPANDNYTLSIENVSTNTFTLVAKAQKALANHSTCKKISLDHQMGKQPLDCWRH